MFHLCLMTRPVSPTPTSLIKMWCRTTIPASLVLCSFVNLVSVIFLIRCISLLFLHDFIFIPLLFYCFADSLDQSGRQVDRDQEYVFLFGVFDEKESIYSPNGYYPDNHVKYTINGYTKGSLPG